MRKSIIVLLAGVLLLTGCSGAVKKGVSKLEAGKYKEAVQEFEKEITSKKHLDEAYRGLGIAKFELGEYSEAAEALEQALKKKSAETATIYSMLGSCYLKTEDYRKALKNYEKALGMKDLTEELKQEIRWNEIAAYEKLGNWDRAKKQMEKYRKDYPNDERVEKEAAFLESR